ncbi:serine/threonine-protein kinase [Streptomyces albicerus]|uniref:serine/threonine-protein kinase n=1 Tax=Streptomyces albicerus TaxID=2569859 RepID=UPI001CEC5728|nr:serine/threonine-protein kinase [Streptomyces albicerus]
MLQALRETDPRRIGPYAVLGRLGAGGMGEVYLAESGTGLRLAVKVVRAEHAEDRTFRARFRQEVRAAQTVGGAGTYTARVVDADTEAERPWMATEFVDGPNLRDAVLDHGALPEDAVRLLAAALGEALVAIHAKGMVHRDLKPSNILLAADGPRVIDFGIVRALEATALTRTGVVVGSVGYVSPEQIRTGGQVGPPSDVFSLGAVLAYAASGREPFGEGKDAVILMRIMNRDFDLSGVPAGIRSLVEPCLSEAPVDRPTPAEVVAATGHTAQSLRQSVGPGWFTAAGPVGGDERWLPERGSGERESRVEYVAPLTIRDVPVAAPAAPSRRRLLQGLAAGGLVAAGAGTGGWLWLRDRDAGGDAVRGKSGGSASPSKRSVATPQPAAMVWAHGSIETHIDGGPVVALSPDADLVYFGGMDGRLRAVAPDGDGRWETRLGEAPLWGGWVGSSVVTADGAYCLHHDGPVKLCAVDPRGRVRWQRALEARFGGFPVQVGDLVLVTTQLSKDKGTVRAFRPDGSVAWNARTQHPIVTTPVVADGVVYVSTFRSLIALDGQDGRTLWTYDAGTHAGRPALVGSTLVLGFEGSDSVLGLSATRGKALWDASNDDVAADSSRESVYIPFGDLAVTTTPDQLVAVDPADGSTVWTVRGKRHAEYSEYYSDPIVHEDLVYALLGQTLHVVNRKGEQRWALTFSDPSVPAFQPVVSAHPERGVRVYVGTRNGIAAVDVPG